MEWFNLKDITPAEKRWCVFAEPYSDDQVFDYDLEYWEQQEYGIGYVMNGTIHSTWRSGNCTVPIGSKATKTWKWAYIEEA